MSRPQGWLADRGAAAVEAALIFPVLVLLLFGIVEFGRGYHTKTTLTHASREGVRVLALGAGDPAAAARAAAPSLNSGLILVVHSPDPCTPGDPVSLTVSYDVDYTIPLFSDGTWTISETATMRCGA